MRSPSTRREWIEISTMYGLSNKLCASPSTRREWIEMFRAIYGGFAGNVSLHAEGVIKLFVLRLKCGIDGSILVV